MSGVAEPVYFGRSDWPLFGWIHRPPGPNDFAVGVVIRSPFDSITRRVSRREGIWVHSRYVKVPAVAAEEVTCGRQ